MPASFFPVLGPFTGDAELPAQARVYAVSGAFAGLASPYFSSPDTAIVQALADATAEAPVLVVLVDSLLSDTYNAADLATDHVYVRDIAEGLRSREATVAAETAGSQVAEIEAGITTLQQTQATQATQLAAQTTINTSQAATLAAQATTLSGQATTLAGHTATLSSQGSTLATHATALAGVGSSISALNGTQSAQDALIAQLTARLLAVEDALENGSGSILLPSVTGLTPVGSFVEGDAPAVTVEGLNIRNVFGALTMRYDGTLLAQMVGVASGTHVLTANEPFLEAGSYTLVFSLETGEGVYSLGELIVVIGVAAPAGTPLAALSLSVAITPAEEEPEPEEPAVPLAATSLVVSTAALPPEEEEPEPVVPLAATSLTVETAPA